MSSSHMNTARLIFSSLIYVYLILRAVSEFRSAPYLHNTTMCQAPETILQRLRCEPFNTDTEAKLRNHPLIAAVKVGKLPFSAFERFVAEQHYVANSDRLSCQAALDRHGHVDKYRPLFSFLAEGMNSAVKLHARLASALGLDDLEEYEPRAECQAYPAQLSKLASHAHPGVLAAAVAVNFPVWGEMCAAMYEGLVEHYGDKVKEEDLEFVKVMAGEVEGLEEMAMQVIEENEFVLYGGLDYKTVKDGVRILQAYELMFWDGVYRD